MEKLKNETTGITIKGIRNLFRLEKENRAIKKIILRNTGNLFANEEKETFYKPVIVNNVLE